LQSDDDDAAIGASNKGDMLSESMQCNESEEHGADFALLLRQKQSQNGMIARQMPWLQVMQMMMTPRQLKK
jgi:hypothetical protein